MPSFRGVWGVRNNHWVRGGPGVPPPLTLGKKILNQSSESVFFNHRVLNNLFIIVSIPMLIQILDKSILNSDAVSKLPLGRFQSAKSAPERSNFKMCDHFIFVFRGILYVEIRMNTSINCWIGSFFLNTLNSLFYLVRFFLLSGNKKM